MFFLLINVHKMKRLDRIMSGKTSLLKCLLKEIDYYLSHCVSHFEVKMHYIIKRTIYITTNQENSKKNVC